MSAHRSLARLPLGIFKGLKTSHVDEEEEKNSTEVRQAIASRLKSNQRATTVNELLSFHPVVIMEDLDPILTLQEVLELMLRVSRSCAPQPKTALQLFQSQPSCLTTGLTQLDTYLRGGIRRASLTELVGPAATAKTQLALQMAVSNAQNNGNTIFIDTEQKVSLARLREMAAHCHLENIMNHVCVHATTSMDELNQLLTGLEDEILTHGDNTVQLLVIDSIAAPARRAFENNVSQASAVMNIANVLKQLADQFQLAVIIINQVDADQRAALGTAWHHCVSTRMHLEQCQQSRSIRVVKSNIVGPSPPFSFQVQGRGLVGMEWSGGTAT